MPVEPDQLLREMKRIGFQVHGEDDMSFSMAIPGEEDAPFECPKHGKYVAEFVLRWAMHHARLVGGDKQLAAALGIPLDLPEPPKTLEDFAQPTVDPTMLPPSEDSDSGRDVATPAPSATDEPAPLAASGDAPGPKRSVTPSPDSG